jgi:hypothetical protein
VGGHENDFTAHGDREGGAVDWFTNWTIGEKPNCPYSPEYTLVNDPPPFGTRDHGFCSWAWTDRLTMEFPFEGPQTHEDSGCRAQVDRDSDVEQIAKLDIFFAGPDAARPLVNGSTVQK